MSDQKIEARQKTRMSLLEGIYDLVDANETTFVDVAELHSRLGEQLGLTLDDGRGVCLWLVGEGLLLYGKKRKRSFGRKLKPGRLVDDPNSVAISHKGIKLVEEIRTKVAAAKASTVSAYDEEKP